MENEGISYEDVYTVLQIGNKYIPFLGLEITWMASVELLDNYLLIEQSLN